MKTAYRHVTIPEQVAAFADDAGERVGVSGARLLAELVNYAFNALFAPANPFPTHNIQEVAQCQIPGKTKTPKRKPNASRR